MLFSTLLTTATLASISFAADIPVKVSNNNKDLTFTPPDIKAEVGDTVTFHYYPQSHSVAQGTFAKPCEPKAGGFWSGYVPVASGMSMTTFQLTINDTKPIWFYCTRADPCQEGMAGGINAASTGNTTDAYIAASKKASANVAPLSSVQDGFGGVLSNSSMASGTMTMSMSSSATGTAAAASGTGTGAASAVGLSKGLGLAALLGFLVV